MISVRSLIKHGFKDSVYYFIGDSSSKLIRVLIIPLLTSMISVSGFAKYDLFLLVSAIISLLTGLGIDSGFAIIIAEHPEEMDVLNVLFTLSLLILIILTLFIWAIFYFLNPFFTFIDQSYIDLMFIYTLFSSLSYSIFNYLRWIGRAGRAAQANFFSSTLGLIIGLVCLWYFKGRLEYLFLGMGIGSLIGMGISVYLARGYIIIKGLNKYNSKMKDLLKISIPFIPNYIVNYLINSADRYIILAYLGINSMGLYSLISRVGQVSTFGTLLFSKGYLPVMYKNFESESGKKLIRHVFHLFNLAFIPLTLLLFILSSRIINFFGGQAYEGMRNLLPIVMISYLIMAGMNINGFGFRIKRRTLFIPIINGCAVIINIALSLILVPRIGIKGVVIGTLIAATLSAYAYTAYSEKFYSFKYNMKFIGINLILMLIISYLILF